MQVKRERQPDVFGDTDVQHPLYSSKKLIFEKTRLQLIGDNLTNTFGAKPYSFKTLHSSSAFQKPMAKSTYVVKFSYNV